MAKYLLFDTETTGAETEDKIIQVGCILLEGKNIQIFDELCSTNVPIKLEAMEVHNITEDVIVNKPSFLNTDFYSTLQSSNSSSNFLIAHNIKFDLGMLEKEGFQNKYTLIDTLKCARHIFGELPYHRLQYLRYALELYTNEEQEAKQLGITIKAHDAIGDVLVMKLLMTKLVQEVKSKYPDNNPMTKLAELTTTPILIKEFKFGKHKGRLLQDVIQEDKGYINWMKKNMDLDEDMIYSLNYYT